MKGENVENSSTIVYSLYRQFPARSPVNGSTEFSDLKYYNNKIEPGQGRTASEQAGYQLAALVVTLAISIIGGLATGKLKSTIPIRNLYYLIPVTGGNRDGIIPTFLPKHWQRRRIVP